MPYATEQDVLDIMDTALTREDVTPFLRTAQTFVSATLTGESYGEALLREIEAYLAAHFTCMRDAQITEEKIGNAASKYEGKTGMGLKHSRYGQQAMILDHHGILKEIESGKRPAEVKVIA